LNPVDIEIVSSVVDCSSALGDKEGATKFLEQVSGIFEEKTVRCSISRQMSIRNDSKEERGRVHIEYRVEESLQIIGQQSSMVGERK
jgi:hypothetical protein